MQKGGRRGVFANGQEPTGRARVCAVAQEGSVISCGSLSSCIVVVCPFSVASRCLFPLRFSCCHFLCSLRVCFVFGFAPLNFFLWVVPWAVRNV